MLGSRWGRAAALLVLVGAGCGGDAAPGPQGTGSARLDWSAGAPILPKTETGLLQLPMANGRPLAAYVPTTYTPGTPLPLLVLLHGSGGTGARILTNFTALAEARGLILVAPSSTGPTWDLVHSGRFGPDLRVLVQAVLRVMASYDTDRARLSLGGYSDGATYALSVGLTNGDVFGRVVAFSPGFLAPSEEVGRPAVFLSHGRQDPVLAFETSGQAIANELQARGYATTFVPFDGSHEIPEAVRVQALDFVVAP